MGYFFEGTTLSGGAGGGGDSANVSLSNLNSAGNGRFDAKANIGLNNLSSDGQMIIDSANGTISNCILEVPQNIKLTLENNVLTLKAGSVLVLGNSATYTTYTTTKDYSTTIPNNRANGTFVITFVIGQGFWDSNIPINETYSGSTAPSTTYTHAIWFDTTNTIIKTWSNIQNAWQSLAISYPLCNIDVKDGVASFAKDSNGNDIIFNGVGFIGHHAFVYPNVRKLICNGKADSKLNSYDELVNGLYIIDLGQSIGIRAVISRNNNTYFSNIYWEVDKYSDLVAQAGVQYCRETNYCYSYSNGIFNEQSRLALAYVTYNGTTVTDFTIRQPYEGARCLLTDEIKEEVATKQADVTTLTGYDATKTQTLKNVRGVLTWVDD